MEKQVTGEIKKPAPPPPAVKPAEAGKKPGEAAPKPGAAPVPAKA